MVRSKATLHDVAAAAGVSIATASKALNDVPVAATNKKKVLQAASRLGYVVNETARALRSNRSFTIGLIFDELSTTRGLGLLDALSKELESAGYSLICATARADADTYDLLMRRFLERRVDGLFCVTPPAKLPSVRRYQTAGIPIVAVTERSSALRTQPLIRPSIDAAARAALEDIATFGHRRILSLDDGSRGLSLATVDPRWQQKADIQLVRLNDIGGLDKFVGKLMQQDKRPTLISAFQPQAEAVLAVCRASGIAVPHHLSIIALTQVANEQRAADLNLSSVLLSPELLGAGAAKQMLRLLQGEKAPRNNLVEIGRWNSRGSLGRVV